MLKQVRKSSAVKLEKTKIKKNREEKIISLPLT
jgi:hypothetical protein